jgi:hypothetical protein
MRPQSQMNRADRRPGLPASDQSTVRDLGRAATTPNGQHRRPLRPVLPQTSLLRTAFGAVLFVAWAIATIVWVASALDSLANGDAVPVVTAVAAVALMVLLACMEGLEVSVIDRWQTVWPGGSTNYLAGWLAARQLFVALIVTAATLLANRSVLVILGTSVRITDAFALNMFDLVWTTLTVLWFAQIFPKHLGAINPDRYIDRLRRPLFPVVGFVHKVGVSQPGEWAADVVEVWLNWAASPEAAKQRPNDEHSHAAIWRQLRRGDNTQHTPESEAPDKAA